MMLVMMSAIEDYELKRLDVGNHFIYFFVTATVLHEG